MHVPACVSVSSEEHTSTLKFQVGLRLRKRGFVFSKGTVPHSSGTDLGETQGGELEIEW